MVLLARCRGRALGSVVALLPAFASCTARPREALVGIAAHPSGHQGALMAVEDLARQGGRLQLREASRDDASNSGVDAVALAQAFSDAGVVAVVGHSASAASLSAAHILNQRGVPMIIPNSTSPLLTGIGPWVFRICATDRAQGEFLASHAYRKGYRRAGIFYVLDDYGKGLASSFARAFVEQGGRIAMALGYPSVIDRPGEDLAPLLRAVRGARPDVVLLAARTRDIVQLRGGQVLRESGWPPLLGGDAIYSPIDLAGQADLFEGLTLTMMTPPSSPEARRFAERYRRRFGIDAENPAYACYDAVMLVGRAVAEEGANREAVRVYLRHLGRDVPAYEGVTGKIRFDDAGDAMDARFALGVVHKDTIEAVPQ